MTSARMVVCASHTPGMLRDKAGEFGHTFRAGVAAAAARVAAFAPDLVVFFGSDHRRAFVDPVPAIAVMTGAEGMGDLGSATGRVAAIYNGQRYAGNPRDIPLNPHAQIQLEIGTPLVAPETITFPPGL